MKTINIILLGILFITTAIDMIPMLIDSKLSEFQKYAYVSHKNHQESQRMGHRTAVLRKKIVFSVDCI